MKSRMIAVVGMTLLAALFALAQEDRNYHTLAIAEIVKENPAKWGKMRTHVSVTGFVTYVKKEGDGDTHVRLCDSPAVKTMDREHCIVAECIPKLPCKPPALGQQVTVEGITRFDAENPGHHWWEIHPVESGL